MFRSPKLTVSMLIGAAMLFACDVGRGLTTLALVTPSTSLSMVVNSIDSEDSPAGSIEATPRRPLDHELQVVREDLLSISPFDRPFTRYLSISPIVQARSPDLAEQYRRTLTVMINALSDEPSQTAPVPIDADHTLYRVDLRHYGWEERADPYRDKWEALVHASPFAVCHRGTEAADVRDLTRTRVPILGVDALREAAARPSVYAVLTDLPPTLSELLARLDVDPDADVLEFEAVQTTSKDAADRSSDPLAFRYETPEERANRPENAPTREANNQLVVFSLPNGLDGHMVVDRTGRRVDEANGTSLIEAACLGDQGEAVQAIHEAYRGSVTLELAAAELGIYADEFLSQLDELDVSLAALGSPLGAVDRSTWRAHFGQTVCAFDLGSVAKTPDCR